MDMKKIVLSMCALALMASMLSCQPTNETTSYTQWERKSAPAVCQTAKPAAEKKISVVRTEKTTRITRSGAFIPSARRRAGATVRDAIMKAIRKGDSTGKR